MKNKELQPRVGNLFILLAAIPPVSKIVSSFSVIFMECLRRIEIIVQNVELRWLSDMQKLGNEGPKSGTQIHGSPDPVLSAMALVTSIGFPLFHFQSTSHTSISTIGTLKHSLRLVISQ